MTGVKLTPDAKIKAVISFLEITPKSEEAAEEKEVADAVGENVEDQELVIDNEFRTRSKLDPHKDFIKAMDKLTKFALELAEIDDNDTSNYSVTAIKIDGDMLLKQSRVTMTLEKYVDRTGGTMSWKVPQCEMYGQSEYANVNQMTKAIEAVITEAFNFLGGKYADTSKGQLPLFERVLMKVA